MAADNDCFGIGGGNDLWIENDCNINQKSGSNLGHSFELPNGLYYESNEATSYLAGSTYFKVLEFEVYLIIWQIFNIIIRIYLLIIVSLYLLLFFIKILNFHKVF